VDKSGLSFSAELGQQVLKRIGDGQSPDVVARQLGRTPETIRVLISMMHRTAALPPRQHQVSLLQLAVAWRNELVASFLSPRETRYATETARELLKLYWIVAASQPQLPRREIYRKVVMARTGNNEEEADTVLRRATQSFATWPAERELTFSDVVHYLAVSEYLALGERIGTRIDMGKLIAGRIPPGL
jgi:DNA-binding CsgD family transcriptional regulator